MTDHTTDLNSLRLPVDVIVVGAGASGLTAAAELGRAAHSVVILEARNRLGGRMFTQQHHSIPVEFGAEFIHGLPPEIWIPLQNHGKLITEVEGDQWCHHAGKLSDCNFFSEVDRILRQMDDRSSDESFLSFLEHSHPGNGRADREEHRRRALAYVSGFNAADPDLVGVHWLVRGMRAEERIEGDRAFRSQRGYTDLLEILTQNAVATGCQIQTEAIVTTIRRKQDGVEVHFNDGRTLSSRKLLVTVPLGVLQAPPDQPGAIRFDPPLHAAKLAAMNTLIMGKVIRVTLCFKTRFWDPLPAPGHGSKTLAGASFLFTEDELFPTWWTTMPRHLPAITGWAPFRSAELLSGCDSNWIIQQAVSTLEKLLAVPNLQDELEAGYVHDWQSDPFSRGAYSYGAVGSDGAQEALASPVNDVLFFAGEATDITGHNGTVHGAIASGHRTAQQMLERF